ALLWRELEPGVDGETTMLARGGVDRADRTHLRHAPTMDHPQAELVRQCPDHRWRAGCAADGRMLERREPELVLLHVVDEIHPHRGYGRGAVDRLGLNQPVEARAVQGPAREN